MKIIVDADAAPVKDEVIKLAGEYKLSVILVSSIAHYSLASYPSYVKTVYVEKGADRADFKIVQLANKEDIIVTQDYGLASLLLPKGCRVVHHKGYEYTNENRSEEHTSELQSRGHLVCRLLLEKKKS